MGVGDLMKNLRNENFVFKEVLARADSLFLKIGDLGNFPLESLAYTEVWTGDPYGVESSFWGDFSGSLTLFVIAAPVIILVFAVVIAIWAILKWKGIRRKSRNKRR